MSISFSIRSTTGVFNYSSRPQEVYLGVFQNMKRTLNQCLVCTGCCARVVTCFIYVNIYSGHLSTPFVVLLCVVHDYRSMWTHQPGSQESVRSTRCSLWYTIKTDSPLFSVYGSSWESASSTAVVQCDLNVFYFCYGDVISSSSFASDCFQKWGLVLLIAVLLYIIHYYCLLRVPVNYVQLLYT